MIRTPLRFVSVCSSQNQNNYTMQCIFCKMPQSISRDQVSMSFWLFARIFAILRNTLHSIFLIPIPITSSFEIYKLCVCFFSFRVSWYAKFSVIHFQLCAYENERCNLRKYICSWHFRISEAFTENVLRRGGAQW